MYRNTNLIPLWFGVITVSFMLMLISNTAFAWHENLGIDAKKTEELYQTKPNDPAIVQWKNSLQLLINDMDKCLNVETAISCETLMATIISNCNSHPNELLACNDTRIAQYHSILKNAYEEEIRKQIEAEVAREKAEIAPIQNLSQYYSKYPNAIGSKIIDNCIINASAILTYNASVYCDRELRSLQQDCQTKSNQYNYCIDQRFVSYLTQHNLTVTPYSNITGNPSSLNSTHP